MMVGMVEFHGLVYNIKIRIATGGNGMPELPEVETVRRTLNELITGKKIKRVTVTLPRILQKPDDPKVFAERDINGVYGMELRFRRRFK